MQVKAALQSRSWPLLSGLCYCSPSAGTDSAHSQWCRGWWCLRTMLAVAMRVCRPSGTVDQFYYWMTFRSNDGSWILAEVLQCAPQFAPASPLSWCQLNSSDNILTVRLYLPWLLCSLFLQHGACRRIKPTWLTKTDYEEASCLRLIIMWYWVLMKRKQK